MSLDELLKFFPSIMNQLRFLAIMIVPGSIESTPNLTLSSSVGRRQ